MCATKILDNDGYPALCDNCDEVDETAMHFEHEEFNWCGDCMRQNHLCLGCGVYLPDVVEDYYESSNDMCSECDNEDE